MRDDELVYMGEDYLPGDRTAPRYACRSCATERRLLPPVAFTGRPAAPPISHTDHRP